jgi:ATP-binding cassette subfamily B protein
VLEGFGINSWGMSASSRHSILGNLRYTPRVIRLVWQAAPGWLIAMILLTIASSLVPIGWLYINKLIIDWLTKNINQPQIGWSMLMSLVGARLLLTLAKTAFAGLRPFISQILNNRLTLKATEQLLRQSIRLDLKHYESSKFFELLNLANQSGGTYPVRALDYATNLLGQLINMAGLLVLLLQFNVAILVLLLLSFIPTLTRGVKHSKQKFNLNRKRTFEGHLVSYFQGLLTQQQFAKEVRLFDLGEHFLSCGS